MCWGKRERCGKKKSDVFISFLRCLVAPGTGFSKTSPSAAEKCVKTPPTRVDVRATLELSYKVT